MSPEQMRTAIKRVYPYPKWQNRVDNMSDKQVAVIYIRMLDKGQLDN